MLEIGFSTGHNLPFLPDAVTSVDALDTYYTESEPRFLGWAFEGRAIRP